MLFSLISNESVSRVDGVGILQRIFSEDFYLLTYPDVLRAQVSPWGHFLEHGLKEGRSPNPYIDPDYMANLLGLPIGQVLVKAFSEKRLWLTNTSPYVDIQTFVTKGGWDGKRHPLEQILREPHVNTRWNKFGPSFSDLAGVTDVRARSRAIAILFHLNGNFQSFSSFREIEVGMLSKEIFISHPSKPVICVPGQFLCLDNVGYFLSEEKNVLTEDNSVIFFDNRFILRKIGKALESSTLVIAPKELNIDNAKGWLATLDQDSVLAPHSKNQEHFLRFFVQVQKIPSIKVLEFGSQAHISCGKVHISKLTKHRSRRKPRRLDRFRGKSMLIVSEKLDDLLKYESDVMKLVSGGASICISDSRRAPFWFREISNTKFVVTCGEVSWPHIWFKDSVPIVEVEKWSTDSVA